MVIFLVKMKATGLSLVVLCQFLFKEVSGLWVSRNKEPQAFLQIAVFKNFFHKTTIIKENYVF